LTHLTYDETEQILARGAQIIHPKSIAPLRAKNIPLYVKPFLHPEAEGTVIKD
jgi:aspartate kinase